MTSQKDKLTPAEGIRHVCGITRATSEFREEPSDGPNTHRRFYTDSPVGSIMVTASVRVLQLYVTEFGVDPFLEMELVVEADGDTSDQPDRWSVTYYHFARVIMRGIEPYLKEYCPAPDEVLDTLMSFDYAK